MEPESSNSVNATPHHIPTSKLAAMQMFKSFTTRKKTTPVIFPPPSWDLRDLEIPQSSNELSQKPESMGFEQKDPAAVEDTVEPISFAQKLRDLIETLPLSGSLTPLLGAGAAKSATISVDDAKKGSPVPPDLDDHLIQMLSSEDVMNGTSAAHGGKGKPQSIWDTLTALGKGRNSQGANTTVSATPMKGEEGEGLMVYTPLEPDDKSNVELAESESVLEYVDEPSAGETKPQPPTQTPKPRSSLEKEVWVPSTTQISVLTTWWGYRLYLPPPVMEKLDSSHLQATARAAMVTTALKWFLEKIPLMLVPPQLRPAVAMLKRLSPVVGYVGVFIAWSWGRISSCDKGKRLILFHS